MVILLAALYSYYKSREDNNSCNTNHVDDSTGELHNDTPTTATTTTTTAAGETTTASSSSSPSTPDQPTGGGRRRREVLAETIQRGGSKLYQHAIVRCSSSFAAAAEMTPPFSATESHSRSGVDATERSQLSRQESFVAVSSPPDVVKQDWIDVCFGHDFLLPHCPNSGESAVGTYQTVTVSIPAGIHQSQPTTTTTTTATANDSSNTEGHNHRNNDDKVGVTIRRLSLGVYVQSVRPGSEAAIANIRPHSVLVAVNDLPVLAEPSQQLLERLWQYEGYFLENSNRSTTNNNNNNPLASATSTEGGTAIGYSRTWPGRTTSSQQPQPAATTGAAAVAGKPTEPTTDGVIREPVALKFVHQKQLYTVILLSNPLWGVQWAPAATNMPLVQRVYAQAAEAGLRRGSLVAAVNGRTFRDMDHVQTALHIRDLYANKQAIRLTMAFPPVTARALHYERLLTGERRVGPPHQQQQQQLPAKKRDNLAQQQQQQPAGQYDGVEVKFMPLGYAIGSLCASDKHVYFEENSVTEQQTVEDLAEAVAAGKVESPLPNKNQRRKAVVAPIPPKYAPCPSLRMEQLLEEWDPLPTLVYCLRFQRSVSEEIDFVEQLNANAVCQQNSPIEMLHELTSGPVGADIASAFLLQFISLICAPGQCRERTAGQSSQGAGSGEDILKKNANELTSMLLKLSRKNEGFCQRLYFLLRSYISTFETRRPQPDGDSRNLMALLNCLELLRFAEKELAGRPEVEKRRSVSSPPTGRDHTFGRVERTAFESSYIAGLNPSPAPTPIPASPESPRGTAFGGSASPKKGNGVLNFLKKSPVRLARKAPSSAQVARRSLSSLNSKISNISNYNSNKQSENASSLLLEQSPSTMYENMSDFLTELDKICANVERSLQKSFRQKIADWAMQPWSAGKDAALAEVTADMRSSLESTASHQMLLVNPVESSELLSSVDCNECYILPSAHFPILLTFNVSERRCSDSIVGEERLYRTKVELLSLKSSSPCEHHTFSVQGAVAGMIAESGESTSVSRSTTHHTWRTGSIMVFETRSSWGAPQTLSLRLSGQTDNFDKRGNFNSEAGFCWLDLSEQWKHGDVAEYSSTKRITTDVWSINSADSKFDDHGDLPEEAVGRTGKMQLEVRVTTESLEFDDESNNSDGLNQSRKRMLLYKHDDDLRQEAFAVQFVRTCSDILKAAGLDMKLLTFQCIPVGTRRGFVEWVPGSVPLSEICHPFSSILPGKSPGDGRESPPVLTKAGLSKYDSLRRLGGQQNESLRRLAIGSKAGARGSIANDPIQDYLRSVAFDPGAPYLIRQDVMDTYVKSCAGYSVITYILGVGDRHLDNLLLHQSGSFFHCDFSFILGSDPKKFLPLRITEDMVFGMGGKESDNYARFLSLIGAAFLALRRPEIVRVLLSMVRLMKASCLPDISENQTIENAILGVRDRLQLDLSESRAITYMEDLVEASLSNKMWIAVDAMHHLGKQF